MLDKPAVLNYKTKPSNVQGIIVMRPSVFGNPFRIPEDGDRNVVCDKFEIYIHNRLDLIKKIKLELKGKNLICCCKPLRCHADTLLRIANELDEKDYL